MVVPPFRVTPIDARTLQLAGELDMATVPLLNAELEGVAAENGLSLDLAELTFLDSSGLNAFAQYARSLNGEGPLVLVNVPDSIADLLKLVGFDQLGSIEIRR